jgi:TRAP-type mannitol/chloroaromatic compound transport system permease large subunit
MAALVPGLVLAAFYLIFVATYAKLKPEVAPPLPPELLYVPRAELIHGFDGTVTAFGLAAVALAFAGWMGVIPTGWATWLAVGIGLVGMFMFAGPLIRKAFIPPVLLIGMIKGSILFGVATPSEAGAVGAFGVMVLAMANRRLTFKMLQGVCHTSARTIAMIFFIIISATCFAYVYRSLGGDDIVNYLITSANLTSWGLLILLMAITFVLGFFLDWIEITLIVLPVFAPLVAGMDFGDHIDPKDIVFWFLILMAINLQTSFLTPPFGFALFYLKGIAPKEIKIQSIYKGIVPFVLIQLLGLILVMWKPNLALWLMKAVYDY